MSPLDEETIWRFWNFMYWLWPYICWKKGGILFKGGVSVYLKTEIWNHSNAFFSNFNNDYKNITWFINWDTGPLNVMNFLPVSNFISNGNRQFSFIAHISRLGKKLGAILYSTSWPGNSRWVFKNATSLALQLKRSLNNGIVIFNI